MTGCHPMHNRPGETAVCVASPDREDGVWFGWSVQVLKQGRYKPVQVRRWDDAQLMGSAQSQCRTIWFRLATPCPCAWNTTAPHSHTPPCQVPDSLAGHGGVDWVPSLRPIIARDGDRDGDGDHMKNAAVKMGHCMRRRRVAIVLE